MVYASGEYFTEALKDNLQDLVTRVNKKKASLIIIQGGVGEGKTTLMVHILNYINKINGLPPIDLEPNYHPQLGQGGVEFLKNLRICFEKKLPCVGYDEAGDFSKRGSLTNFNAMLNRTFDTFRAFKCIVVIALPNFDVLDQEIFDKKIPRFMINCKDRTENQGLFGVYSLYRMLLLKSYMKKMQLKNYAYSIVEPNFYGNFVDLDPESSKKLDRLSTSSKLNILRKSEVRMEGLLTVPELATKLMKSVSWVRSSMKNLGLKSTRMIERVKYYDVSVLNRLSEHFDYVSENPAKKTGRPKKE